MSALVSTVGAAYSLEDHEYECPDCVAMRDGETVTLIGAVSLGDRAIIAADSQSANPAAELTWTSNKLYELGDRVVWGHAGDEDLGREFRRLLNDNPPTAGSWLDLRKHLQRLLSEIVSDRRAAARSFGAELGPHQLISILVAGQVGGVFDLAAIHPDGGIATREVGQPIFEGTGMRHARVAFATIQALKMPNDGTAFRVAMQTGTATTLTCEGPIAIWTITADGIEKESLAVANATDT